jgi:hypothetical protein
MIKVTTDNKNELPYFSIDEGHNFDEYRAEINKKSTGIKSLFANDKELIIIIKWIKVHNEKTIPFMHGHCFWRGDIANFIFDNLD